MSTEIPDGFPYSRIPPFAIADNDPMFSTDGFGDLTVVAEPAPARQPAWDTIKAMYARMWNDPTPHPFDQIAGHFGDEPCSCMHFMPTEPWTLAQILAGPVHPDVVRPILRVRGAYCTHPQLPGWRLAELTLPGGPCIMPWPGEVVDGEMGRRLRSVAARRTGHDPGLISISLPDRDCARHAAAPVEVAGA